MPKLKTHRGAAKRFSLTGTGKVKRSKAYASHILTSKTTKTEEESEKISDSRADDTNGIKRLIPYL